MFLKNLTLSVAAACAAGALVVASPALAQQNVMKECGAKWQAAKAANQTGGLTWSKFLAKCRTDMAAKPAAAPAAKPAAAKADAKPAPAKAAARTSKPDAKKTSAPAAATTAAGGFIFPKAIDPEFKNEKPGIARNKTCAKQYNANKAAGKGNGALNYIPRTKGGDGYWPKCNAALKG